MSGDKSKAQELVEKNTSHGNARRGDTYPEVTEEEEAYLRELGYDFVRTTGVGVVHPVNEETGLPLCVETRYTGYADKDWRPFTAPVGYYTVCTSCGWVLREDGVLNEQR